MERPGKRPSQVGRAVASALAAAVLTGCGGAEPASRILEPNAPLHLEDHLESATITGSLIPDELAEPIEWSFDSPDPAWKRAFAFERDVEPATLTWTGEALRLTFDERHRDSDGLLVGAIYVDVPDLDRATWGWVAVTARADPGVEVIAPAFNVTEPGWPGSFEASGPQVDVMDDGTVQTYLLEVNEIWWGAYRPPWRQLGIWVSAERATQVDILSVALVSVEASYATANSGVVTEARGNAFRRSIYLHAPARVEYRVRVPDGARLDVGLGVIRDGLEQEFVIDAVGEDGERQTLLQERFGRVDRWGQRQVDLSDLAGQVVTLGLGLESELPGSVALWATPTLSFAAGPEGRPAGRATRPNVVFYVIDGASAESMSLYGYPRRTTPNLERLAREGTVFERAYSNASWTRPSTPSFLTSLYHSTLGGAVENRTSVPMDAPTIAELLHGVGYQTASLTTNANAGRMSGLERGLDLMREAWVEDNRSSESLHGDFWRWREEYPGTPYWVHFQPTDVHSPNLPVPPYAGLWASPERTARRVRWEEELSTRAMFHSESTPYSDAFDLAGVDRIAYFTAYRDTYDETMALQDARIGQLVDRLKATGEWSDTLLIVGSDHGHQAGTRHFGLGMLEELPPIWDGAMLTSFQTRIPLLFVWPGRIQAGVRIEGPVSMIDVVPTILELLGLPVPEHMQGRSLAGVLLGQQPFDPRPVFLDEFNQSDELRGEIEVIDGRWGASLYVGPTRPEGLLHLRGHRDSPPPDSRFWEGVPEETPRLLLFDLWDDPRGLRSVHESYPELVSEYTRMLEEELRRHRELGERFARGEATALSAEQLRTLRALGYIR